MECLVKFSAVQTEEPIDNMRVLPWRGGTETISRALPLLTAVATFAEINIRCGEGIHDGSRYAVIVAGVSFGLYMLSIPAMVASAFRVMGNHGSSLWTWLLPFGAFQFNYLAALHIYPLNEVKNDELASYG